MSFTAKVLGHIRRHGMVAPGDRVSVAASGGADSVALLRALTELRGELGCVLAVAHFNHQIRPESDGDAAFVAALAREFELEFLGGAGDAKKFALHHRVSLEAAARCLRYDFFAKLPFDKVATAHTLDDQAETVLMKLMRGAGTKGLAGIWPSVKKPLRRDSPPLSDVDWVTQPPRLCAVPEIIRPMLAVRRKEVEAYLGSLGQDWRDDATNRDLRHTRNKVRHELLPLLEAGYNPNIYQQLADAAEVARGDEEFWQQFLSQSSGPLQLHHLNRQPLAVRRQLVRRAYEQASGKTLDFEHTDALVRFLERRESSRLQLPERWFAVLDWPRRVITFEQRAPLRKPGTVRPKSPSKSMSKKSGRHAGRRV